MMHLRHRAVCTAAAAILLVLGRPALSQDYPARPVRLVVPYPPGSGTDIVARLLGQKLSESLGQQVFVDNRPGAGATVGTDAVAKSDPDGHTLLMADLGPLAIAPSFYPKLPYSPTKDLVPISEVAVLPFVLAGNPSVPARTVPELIALAKSKPGELTYASTGNGTAVHLTTKLFKQLTGIEMTHVPYRGSAPALTDLVAGRISVMFVNVLSAMSFVNSGQLRALAIGTPRRSGAFPDVPTFAEVGMPGFEAGVWFGILAPAGTPGPVIERLNAEIRRALEGPDIREKLAQQGAEIVVSTPEQFAAKIRAEADKWAKVIAKSGTRME